jgi:hypothetical protein
MSAMCSRQRRHFPIAPQRGSVLAKIAHLRLSRLRIKPVSKRPVLQCVEVPFAVWHISTGSLRGPWRDE